MRQADTAIAAHRALVPALRERQSIVRQLLREFRTRYETWPTSLELLRYATSTHVLCRNYDVNSIRPRLHELEAQGYVAKGPKRLCSITRKKVYTWLVATPAPPRFDDPALERARQVELF